jgi:uncharacterized caspase-like protein
MKIACFPVVSAGSRDCPVTYGFVLLRCLIRAQTSFARRAAVDLTAGYLARPILQNVGWRKPVWGTGMQRRWLCSIAMVVCSLAAWPASADNRVALVIGNGAYAHAPHLPNPSHDAEDVAAALKRNGFQTIVGIDLDKAGMEEATIKFARAARTADVAMFYYSGHALQYAGINYLIPVDARLTDEADLRRMSRVDEIVADLQQARNLRVVVLDSCRDNPLADDLKRSIGSTRSAGMGRGLAKMESPDGTIISYSTQSGRTADDGIQRNSPYTTAFLEHIEDKDDISAVFHHIGSSVYQSTRGKQVPELSLSFFGEFYLNGPSNAAAAAPAPRPAAPAASATPADSCAAASDHYKSAEAIDTAGAFEDHLARFPDCAFAGLARAKLEQIRTRTAAAIPPVAPAPATPGHFGAVARKSGNFFFAWNYKQPEEAKSTVLSNCKSDSCKLEATLSGTRCFVIFRNKNGVGNAWGWAVRDDVAEASEVARTGCSNQGRKCAIAASFCADGSNQYNRQKS